MQAISRDLFLYLSKNKTLNRAAQNWGGELATGNIIGGTDFSSSIHTINELNSQGFSVTVDHLGEFVTDQEVATERANECIKTIEMISNNGLDSHVSLKLTSLGLGIDDRLVYENMKRILDTADKHEVMVTIDMEDELRCQKTIDIFKEFKEQYTYVSTVLQAYLYRTKDDLTDLQSYHPFLRLVKGAYKESARVAYPEKKNVDENFKKLIKNNLLNGYYTGIATHDDKIIEYTKNLVKEHGIGLDTFEFQMLYGMRSTTQMELLNEGFNVRIYVPYGEDWYGYFMRRLAERPANLAFVLKGLAKK
ncbi:proline dehydrogenase family protein [Bacillus sp. AK128]